MFDIIANFFLIFGRDTVIIPLIILGFIWKDHGIFYRAVYLILFGMIFNTALKLTFQIPLSPALGKEGFAFPSGHMLSSTVFYAWIAYNIPSFLLRLSVLILLFGIGNSLVYCGYHNYFDIFGAVFFSILILIGYRLLEHKFGKREGVIEAVLLTTLAALIIYIYVRTNEVPEHVWLAYYALIGFICSLKVFLHKDIAKSWSQKLLASSICFLGIFLINRVSGHQLFSNLPLYLNQLYWVLIGFIIPCSSFISTILVKKNA